MMKIKPPQLSFYLLQVPFLKVLAFRNGTCKMSRRSTHRRELGSTGDNLELNHDPSHPFQLGPF